MAIPQLRRSLNEQRKPFKKLNDLFNEIAQGMDDDSCFDTLSMGMSSDQRRQFMRIPILSELELIFLVQDSRLIYEILCFYWWGQYGILHC